MRLELRAITKRFGSFTANDQISITVEPGQIHSLLGENGAGKSTLMNVLFGLLTPDEGEIVIDGVPTTFRDSGEAVRRGSAAAAPEAPPRGGGAAENSVGGFRCKLCRQISPKIPSADFAETSVGAANSVGGVRAAGSAAAVGRVCPRPRNRHIYMRQCGPALAE